MALLADLGVVVNAYEARTAAVCVNPGGDARLAIAARGWVLIVDPMTGRCRQVGWDEALWDYPFASLATRDGQFWTGAGKCLIHVDPFAETVTTWRPCDEESIIGFALAEGPDGRVWFATYPHCRLFWIDPAGGGCVEAERLSETEEYVSHLAVGSDGWIYAGIGTERKDLVALLPGRAGPVSLTPPEARTKGSGYVHLGVDGAVYGHYDSSERHPGSTVHAWKRLAGGQSHPVDVAPPPEFTGRGFGRVHLPVPAPWSVEELHLDTHQLSVLDAAGQPRQVRLDYECAGAMLSPLTLGPDGLIYGTSNHPMHLYTMDPVDGTVTVHGPDAVAAAGGNICAWTAQAGILAGPAYAGGHLFLLDPAQPVVAGVNPRHVSRHEPVHRPRCVVAHPDGEHVIWGGYGGYGDLGGGLVVTHRPTAGVLNEADDVLLDRDVVPYQATTAIGALSSGDLVGATSVETPGGGHPHTATATAYVVDWPSRTVVSRWEPHPMVRTWAELAVAEDDLVHLISAEGLHLLIDPAGQRVVEQHDWTSRGPVAMGGVVVEGGAAYFIQRFAATRVDLRTRQVEVVVRSTAPLTAGGAVVDGQLFAASGSRMLRCDL